MFTCIAVVFQQGSYGWLAPLCLHMWSGSGFSLPAAGMPLILLRTASDCCCPILDPGRRARGHGPHDGGAGGMCVCLAETGGQLSPCAGVTLASVSLGSSRAKWDIGDGKRH